MEPIETHPRYGWFGPQWESREVREYLDRRG